MLRKLQGLDAVTGDVSGISGRTSAVMPLLGTRTTGKDVLGLLVATFPTRLCVRRCSVSFNQVCFCFINVNN